MASAGGPRVLIVEDEAKIAELLVAGLERAGYVCRVAHDGPGGLAAARAEAPDVVLLDLMLPGMDGLAVCRTLRAESPVPILMLTARDAVDDKVLGLDLGADDYITKPFSLKEVEARIRSALRRARPEAEADAGPETHGPLSLDRQRRHVAVRGDPVSLTATEFDLLAHMAREPGRVFTREDLLQGVWGYSFDGYGRTVDSHVTRLRKKLGGSPRLLHTVWGVGYKFEVE